MTFATKVAGAGDGSSPIRLRAHHLLCVLTYVGSGYSPRFVATMSEVVARLGAGADFVLVEGRDALCESLDADDEHAMHCAAERNLRRDDVAREQIEAVLERPLTSPTTLSTGDFAKLRRAFAGGGAVRRACEGCEWRALCDEVSARDFAGSELLVANRAT